MAAAAALDVVAGHALTASGAGTRLRAPSLTRSLGRKDKTRNKRRRRPAGSCGLRAASCELRAASCELRAASYELLAASCTQNLWEWSVGVSS